MNIQFRESQEAASPLTTKTAIADCDIHPARATRTELYPYLERKIPIIVYDSVYLKTPVAVAKYVVDGKTWHFYHNEHCIVLCGYDPEKHRVLVSDALSGLVWRDEKRFEKIYDALGRMAVVIA